MLPMVNALTKPVTIISLGMPTCGNVTTHVGSLYAPLVNQADVLVAGKRYLDLFSDFAGEKCVIAKEVDSVIRAIRLYAQEEKRVVILASGDSLFFGIGNRALAELGEKICTVIPAISSRQAAGVILGIPDHQLECVSLHGRDSWLFLAHALLEEKNVFLLTDEKSTPDTVALYLQERGFFDYQMVLFENICFCETKGFQAQTIKGLTLDEALVWKKPAQKGVLRSLVLFPESYLPYVSKEGLFVNTEKAKALFYPGVDSHKEGQRKKDIPTLPLLGTPDSFFEQEKRLITKRFFRASGLAALQISPWHTIWDIGAGSGAVSIEASRLARRGVVYAVEQQTRRVDMILRNRIKMRAANLEVYEGKALDIIQKLPAPDRVFLGGGLGGSADAAEKLLTDVWGKLLPGGRIVANCVLLQSMERFRHIIKKLGGHVEISQLIVSDSVPLGQDMYLRPENPVYLMVAEKEGV